METQGYTHALQWEMYGPGTALEFSAQADTEGYRLTLTRDHSPLLTGVAADAATLFRISSDLRAQLQQLGFGAKPLPDRMSVLEGGPCWGPATPLRSSLIESLH